MTTIAVGFAVLLLFGGASETNSTVSDHAESLTEDAYLNSGDGHWVRHARWTFAFRDTSVEDIRTPNTFYDLLRFLDDSASADRVFSRPTIRRQLDGLQVVLPDSMVKGARVEKGAETGRADALARGAGRAMERWWRRQDPYPATEANERLQEHLKRVSYAFQHYSREDDAHHLDDRGRVYVRYGPPNRSREIFGGEFWTYGFQTAAEYLFVCERGDGCELGQPIELIPPRLRHGHGPTDRGTRKAIRSLSILESVYEELAHHRSRYGITRADLSMYNEQIRQRLDGLATPMNTRPHSFVAQKIAEIKQEEVQARRRREETVPQTRSSVGNEFENLPVAARWIRSLTDNGNTRVKLVWSVPRSALRLSEEQKDDVLEEGSTNRGRQLLSASLVRYTGDYDRQAMDVRHHLLPPVGEQKQGVLSPRQESFLMESTLNAALQVDLTWASIESSSETVRPRAKLKVGTSRADSLEPLRSDPSQLEISDLQPVLLWTDSMSIDEAPVYPFRKLVPDTPLALRFEVYHLSTDEQERTDYSVEYEVYRETERGGFSELFRGDTQERTAVKSQFEGRETRVGEYVLLDPENWTKKESQSIRITVRVTDEQTGHEVTRSVDFTLPSRQD